MAYPGSIPISTVYARGDVFHYEPLSAPEPKRLPPIGDKKPRRGRKSGLSPHERAMLVGRLLAGF